MVEKFEADSRGNCLPYWKSKITWITLARSGQKTAVNSPLQKQQLRIYPGDIRMKPPDKNTM